MQQVIQSGGYVVKADSGAKFLVRLIALIAGITFLIGALGVFFWRVDLVAWFTPFKVLNRDALTLFAIFIFLSVAFIAIARQWEKLIWWMFIASLVFVGYATHGKWWGDSTTGPGVMHVIKEKFNLDNIKSLSGSTIPTQGMGKPFTPDGKPTHQPAVQAPAPAARAPANNTAARAKAMAAKQKAINITKARLKQRGYTYDSIHSPASSSWCSNKAARLNWDKKHPKLNWLDDAKCLLGQNWSIK